MNYGNPEYNELAMRAMDTVQDKLERDICAACGHARGQHANGQGIQPSFVQTPCKLQCTCDRFREAA